MKNKNKDCPHRFTRKRSYGGDMNRKTRSRHSKKVIRETTFFRLTYIKASKEYIIRDILNYEEMTLTKEEVSEAELTITTAQDFNFHCTHLFE